MLDISKALKCERKVYCNSSCYVYTFKCIECDNLIKSERKYLTKHSGKCRFCCHKGIPYLSSYNHLKDGIKRLNIRRKKERIFELTFEEFLEFTKILNCHYCQTPIQWVKHSGQGKFRTNLDRKNTNLGCSVENCVVCCKECNYMKNSYFSYEEFLVIRRIVSEMRKK